MDFIQNFSAAMAYEGISFSGEIIPDGILHRFHIDGDKYSSRNGWYVLYPDGLPSGAFGNWKVGIHHKWCSKSQDRMISREWADYCEKMKDVRHQREQAKAKEQQQAANRARRIWDRAKTADPHHPYLLKKYIPPFIARQIGSSLVLPINDFEEQIWSLQFIDPEGSKRLLSGGSKKSHFIPINKPSTPAKLLICEGFATGATLAEINHEAAVIAAIDAGNLKTVAIAARACLPHLKIIICGDDDRLIPDNPGRNKARQAAISASTLLAFPEWPTNAPASLSDFNDLACWLKNKMEVTS